MVGLTVCQPILLQKLIQFINSDSSLNDGYGLLGAYSLVYTGLAVSSFLALC
jgi:ATP-binding cassette, subfamily C (CFTR/MRP), member 1